MPPQVVVHVAHEMDKTLLLRTLERVVRGKEIRDENSLIPAKQVIEESSLARLFEQITGLSRARNNPDISDGLAQFHRRLVDVNDVAVQDRSQYCATQLAVIRGKVILEFVYDPGWNAEIENILKAAIHAEERLLAQNVVVDAPAHEAMAVSDSSLGYEGEVGRCECVAAFFAVEPGDDIARLPFLHTDASFVVLQVYEPACKPCFA